MLILKGELNPYNQISDADIIRIAKHAINFMAGIKLFDDNGSFNPDATEKFPQFNVCNMDMFIKASSGYIILPADADTSIFIDNFITQLVECENEYMKKHDKHKDYLLRYHSVSNSIYTTLKVKSDLRTIGKKSSEDNYRILVTDEKEISTKQYARFTWKVININKIELEITNRNRLAAFELHVCSILYDNSVTNYQPNEFIYTLKPQKCIAWKNVGKNMEVMLSPIYPHIHFEILKKYQKIVQPQAYNSTTIFYSSLSIPVRDITKFVTYKNFNVYEAVLTPNGRCISPHEGCEIELPLQLKKNVMRYDICTLCKGTLFGENYVFLSITPANMSVNVLCPYCAHFDSYFVAIRTPQFIFKVMWHRTIEKHIDDLRVSKEKKKLLLNVIKGVFRVANNQNNDDDDEDNDNSNNINYLLIGDSYIGVTSIEQYIFTHLSVKYPNRQAVLLANNTKFKEFPLLE